MRLASLLSGLLLAACAAPAPDRLAAYVAERPLVLLGEVHDNAAQHAMRLDALRSLLRGGARPALLFEQFDRERQADIDRARKSAADADTLIAAGAPSKSGWDWLYYKPFVELALAHGLPIVAANVSRADARRIIDEGLAAHGFTASVPRDIADAQTASVVAGHCGQLSEQAARRLTAAQIARDQWMARLVGEHAARGAVLLAGNGHVRTDVGVPRWLAPELRERTISIGLLEAGDADGGAFDRVVATPRQQRADPCAGLRMSSIASP